MPESGAHRVFVYGTLRRGQPAHGYVAGFPLEAAQTRGRLYAMPGDYPALVLDGPGIVVGEVVEVDGATLTQLDAYEAVDTGLYRRERIPLVDGSEAWAYVMDGPAARGGVPTGGDWAKRAPPTP
jgi:gamma-glutamylaminecyclotransferase